MAQSRVGVTSGQSPTNVNVRTTKVIANTVTPGDVLAVSANDGIGSCEFVSPGGGDVATDAIFDAKGDLAVGTGADTAAKLTVGSDGQIPYADAAEATGIRWGAPPAGGGGGGSLQFTELASLDGTGGDVDVTGYDQIQIIWDDVTISSAGYVMARVSTDGVTYDDGATDYKTGNMSDSQNSNADTSYLFIGGKSTDTGTHHGVVHVYNLASSVFKTKSVSLAGDTDASGDNALRQSWRNAAQVDTHIRILTSAGSISAGKIRVLGVGPGNFGTEVTTTDATVTTCGTIATANDTAYHVRCVVTARETVDSDEVASYELRGTFRNDGGTLTLVGSVTVVHSAEDTAAWNATLDASGTDIRCRVTGAAATNIDWTSKLSFEVA